MVSFLHFDASLQNKELHLVLKIITLSTMSFIASHYVLQGPTHNGWLFLVYASQHSTVFISHYVWIKFLVQSANLDFSMSNRRMHNFILHGSWSATFKQSRQTHKTQCRTSCTCVSDARWGSFCLVSFRIQHIFVMCFNLTWLTLLFWVEYI
jgi:hypothetical protein